jgi:hypothetical protein
VLRVKPIQSIVPAESGAKSDHRTQTSARKYHGRSLGCVPHLRAMSLRSQRFSARSKRATERWQQRRATTKSPSGENAALARVVTGEENGRLPLGSRGTSDPPSTVTEVLPINETLLRLDGVPGDVRHRLMPLLVLLDGVRDLVRGTSLPKLQLTRLNARYHAALHLADLILRGVSVEQLSGSVSVTGFHLTWRGSSKTFLLPP